MPAQSIPKATPTQSPVVSIKWSDVEAEDDPSVIPLIRKTDEYLIGPDLAAEWLKRNTHNRPLNMSVIGIYARDITAGNWQMNGETIKFSKSGVLLDGQHRLQAIIVAGKPIRSSVIFGLADEVFATIDAGQRRTMAHVLSISNKPNAALIAAALNVVWRYENEAITTSQTHSGKMPTHEELLEIFARHPGIENSIPRGASVRALLGSGLATALHYLFSLKDAALADVFFDSLSTGENLSKGEPVLTLRNKLTENRASRAKLPRGIMVRMCLKAWNATRHSRSLHLIKLIDNDPETLQID